MAGARAVLRHRGSDDAAHSGGRRSHARLAAGAMESRSKSTWTNPPSLAPAPERSILALDEALTAFSQVAPRQAKVVELRYFGGLTEEEIEAVLKISPRTIRRDWDLAKAWLLRELSHTTGKPSGSSA